MVADDTAKCVVRYLGPEDVLRLRCSRSLERVVASELELILASIEARLARQESRLRSVCDATLCDRTTSAMRRARKEVRRSELVALCALASPDLVKPIAAALEVLLGPNAGPEGVMHWPFLRRSLRGKWQQILQLLQSDAVAVVASYASTPARLARVRDARRVLADAGHVSRDAIASTSILCAKLWPVVVGLLDIAADVAEADVVASARDLAQLTAWRRHLQLAVIVRDMHVDARRYLARRQLRAALPLLTSDLELFVASLSTDGKKAKNAILRRKLELLR